METNSITLGRFFLDDSFSYRNRFLIQFRYIHTFNIVIVFASQNDCKYNFNCVYSRVINRLKIIQKMFRCDKIYP